MKQAGVASQSNTIELHKHQQTKSLYKRKRAAADDTKTTRRENAGKTESKGQYKQRVGKAREKLISKSQHMAGEQRKETK